METRDEDDWTVESPPRKPLRRLRKGHAEEEERVGLTEQLDDDLADSLAKLALHPKQLAATSHTIPQRRPSAGECAKCTMLWIWSRADSDMHSV